MKKFPGKIFYISKHCGFFLDIVLIIRGWVHNINKLIDKSVKEGTDTLTYFSQRCKI